MANYFIHHVDGNTHHVEPATEANNNNSHVHPRRRSIFPKRSYSTNDLQIFFPSVDKNHASKGPTLSTSSTAKDVTTTNSSSGSGSGAIDIVRPTPTRITAPRRHLAKTQKVKEEQKQQQQQQQEQQQQTESNWNNVPKKRKKNRGSARYIAKKYGAIKASWYHDVAVKNRLGSISEDPQLLDIGKPRQTQSDGAVKSVDVRSMLRCQEGKLEVLKELNESKGNCNSPAFREALQKLIKNYDPSHFDPRRPTRQLHHQQHGSSTSFRGSSNICPANELEGIGISAGKPTFPGCIGYNANGDPMYKLGTMAFDMFRPTQLVTSVQGTFAVIDSVYSDDVKHCPANLPDIQSGGTTPLRTYDIVTSFTIEPWNETFGEDSPNKDVHQPIRGVMTAYGFILPYPTHHRFSVWFTGGSLEVDDHNNETWFRIFDGESAPKRTITESTKLVAAKLLMGASTSNDMDEKGKLSYTLLRPRASYLDLLYLDKTMQIFRGSSGTVYVHIRLPGSQGVSQSKSNSGYTRYPRHLLTDDDEDDDAEEENEQTATYSLEDLEKHRREQQCVVPSVPNASPLSRWNLRRVASESSILQTA